MTRDLALEQRLGRVLNAGGVVSTVLLAAGLVSFFVQPTHPVTDWLLHGGLVLLMATPVARVLVSTVGYLLDRDWFFATLALMVLSVLVAGVAIAIAR